MAGTRSGRDGKTAEVRASAGKEQSEAFERAMALFHQRQFERARELFAKAEKGPEPGLAHSAAMHARMCERRLAAAEAPRTPEELYAAGVALLNLGKPEQARSYLQKALAADGKADHYHYAMALCLGQLKDLEGSAKHLSRAIELQPGNRTAALKDADFQPLLRSSPLKEVLNSERSTSQ